MYNQKTLIKFKNLYSSFGKDVLLGVEGSILSSDRIGLVGINGAGKSTLMRELVSENKNVEVINNARILYVQQLDFDEYRSDIPLYEFLSNQHEEWWQIFTLLHQIFATTISESTKLCSLSGGELMKVKIALAIAQNPDLLILDEPTNHLDSKSVEHLEKFLVNSDIAFVVISHDVHFLNETVNKIWELKDGKLRTFVKPIGSQTSVYNYYLDEKRKESEALQRKHEVAQKEFRKAQIELQKENIKFQSAQAKLKRMAKENDRSIPRIKRNAMKLAGQSMHGKAKQRIEKDLEKHINQAEESRSSSRKSIFIDFKSSIRTGRLISITNGVLKIDGKLILTDINFDLSAGERVAIAGENGSGKTSFINQLMHQSSPLLEGNMLYGQNYKTVYIDQKYDLVDLTVSPMANVRKIAPEAEEEEITKALASTGFNRDQILYSKAAELSGGEIAKLVFVLATMSQADLIIMDEPTNNLDIDTKDRIVDLLENYRGALVVVSHDRDFVNNVGIEKRYEIIDRKLKRIE